MDPDEQWLFSACAHLVRHAKTATVQVPGHPDRGCYVLAHGQNFAFYWWQMDASLQAWCVYRPALRSVGFAGSWVRARDTAGVARIMQYAVPMRWDPDAGSGLPPIPQFL
jgi:hypothetical protein